MNIFILDNNPKLAAQYHCDKHCVKMILESAQLLCAQFEPKTAPYKRTHYNHPCSQWVRESITNFNWLVTFAYHLCDEYKYRYGKVHKSRDVILWCNTNKKNLNLPNISQTPFCLAMPDVYKTDCPVQSYRNYYLGDKKDICKWKTRVIPTWFKENEIKILRPL
tara:strand:- start:2267 stop:2758 length:492 start_codon:yes stop_codon:yes gene_type:complete